MRFQTALFGWLALALVTAVASAPLAAGGQDRAADILAQARKAIGAGTLDALKTFSLEARSERNIGNFQMNADIELTLALPDKYVRVESSSGGPVNFTLTSGFSGDRPLAHSGTGSSGGAVVFRMGPGGPPPGEKPTPEQQAEMDRVALRAARQDISRLMLGWFGMAHPAVRATYTYAGEAESPDGKADVIDVTGADGFSARVFIDQERHLPLMITYQGPQRRVITAGGPPPAGAPGRRTEDDDRKMDDTLKKSIADAQAQPPAMVEYRMYFSDWTETGGITFPMKLQRASAGTIEEEWTVTRVKVNPKVDPAKFDTKG